MVEIGDKVNGRYKIIGNVGSGGMANVFLAHDLILDRDVAVKVLRFDFLDDQSAIRRFQREALAASELVHPNIVGVYDVGEEDGRQYLVMEYVKGTDLKKYIQQNFPIPLENVILIMRQILAAIALAHEHRIIHRDLKPQNILMDEEGNVKIADFGIAIALSETSLTQTNTLLGSVHYLSPEQARGSMATRQSDLYALGIILYELLAGKVPFEGESAVSIALKHFQSEIPSVREMNPMIPQALENVILRATTKDAADRYVSAEEMGNDIATSLSPSRVNEPRFEPQAMLEETKVLTPISDSDMPDEFREMDSPAEGSSEEELEDQADQAKIKKKKKNAKRWLAALIVVILGVVAFLVFAPRSVEIPDVSAKTVDEATQILEEKGFQVSNQTETERDDDVAEGLVIKTSPREGSKRKKGQVITLVLSGGPSTVEIGDYTGKTFEQAREELIALGFASDNIKKKEVEDSEYEAGEVTDQDPSAGSKLAVEKSVITLSVSKGKQTVTLKNLSGFTISDAENYLKENNLNIEYQYEYSNNISKNLITRTSPDAGAEVDEKNTITLYISNGPIPTEPSSTTPPVSSSQTSTTTSESTVESTTSPSTTESSGKE